MNIGYVYNFNCYPPRAGGSIHVYQVINKLMKRKNILHVLDIEQMPELKKYPKTKAGIELLCKNVDVLCIRIDGIIENEIFNLLPSKHPPVIWEINAPLEEEIILWEPSRTGLHIKSRMDLFKNNLKRKKLAKSIDGSICVSKELVKYSKEFLNIKKSFLVSNGSDMDIFHPKLKDDNIYNLDRDCFKVLWSGGSMWPWQGTSLIYKIAKKMLLIDNKIKFILITNPKYLKFKLLENMVVINEIPYLDVPKYFASADTALCLYHEFSWCKWGFYLSPLKLFDYLASGIPVIASDFGQIGKVIRNGENGFLPNNNLVEKILFLKNNPNKAKEMGYKARQDIISYYNWDRVAEQLENIFKEIVEAKQK